MQIAMNVPFEKADFMVEMLKNFSFVKDITINTNKKVVFPRKRRIGLLDGVGDIVFKDDWEMSEEEFLGIK
jgi:hypothetical protein